MTQPRNTNLGEQPMTTYGRAQGPEKRYRRLRFPSFPAATWAEKNPLLQRGEIGAESDTLKMKIGDGITYWNDLGYSKSFADWGDISGNIQDQNDLVEFVNNSVQSGINTHNSSSTAHSNQFSQYRKSSAQDAIDANLQSQITTNANNIASNDTDIANLQANKADKTADFETPITASNKGATMAEIEQVRTATIKFTGYVSTSAPSASSYTLMEGNLWINSATMPTSFPVPSSSIQQWNGTAWVAYSQSYTPAAFDAWSNLNNNEGYYFFGGVWKVFSTDLSTEYFTLNQTSGLWEIAPSIELPGTPTVATPDGTNPQAIVNVDYVNSGITIGNKITNCILQIPQISLSIQNGSLVLASGTNVYVANNGISSLTTSSELTYSTGASSGQYMIILNGANAITSANLTSCSSGTLAQRPTNTPTSTGFYYATDTKTMYNTSNYGSTWNSGTLTLPIAIATVSNGQFTSVTTFNGVGYIGATLFSVPGLLVSAPNGRNSDGTLNNVTNSQTNVNFYTLESFTRTELYVGSAQIIAVVPNTYTYDFEQNKVLTSTGDQRNFIKIGTVSNNGTTITGIEINEPFAAVDYNEYVKDLSNVNESINQLEADKQDNLTASQLNAVNSGITATKVATYDGYAGQIAGKQNTLTAGSNIRISGNTISATGLAKTDLSNVSAEGIDTAVGWGIPDYSAEVVKATGEEHIAETDGIVYGFYTAFGAYVTSATITVDGIVFTITDASGSGEELIGGGLIVPVSKGQSYILNKGTLKFYPLKGAK